ncbi:surface-adhesin E family protein [Chitinibacter tainanensis]|uniref:surface-adhesin E family protein n=1 Tax=Chitinibacter tainanensis TaxID=230667 RepID=UPI0023569B45|nr:surface-adhesin E family protein [Chitinibacter tainanensis]
MQRLLLGVLVVTVAACGKYEDKVSGPVPVPDQKADWRSYGKMPDFETLVDVNSIQHDAGYAEQNYTFVWMVQRFNEDQIDGTSKGKYRYKYTRQAIDCPSGKMAGVAVSMNDADDLEVARYDVPGFQWEFAPQQPGTFGADFVAQVCKMMAEKDQAKQAEE